MCNVNFESFCSCSKLPDVHYRGGLKRKWIIKNCYTVIYEAPKEEQWFPIMGRRKQLCQSDHIVWAMMVTKILQSGMGSHSHVRGVECLLA